MHDYHSESWGTRLQYMWLYILLTKSFLVYLSDLYTAMTMLTTHGWSNGIFEKCRESQIADNCVVVNFTIGKWIFVGCIIFGYLLVRVTCCFSWRLGSWLTLLLVVIRMVKSQEDHYQSRHFVCIHQRHGEYILQSECVRFSVLFDVRVLTL